MAACCCASALSESATVMDLLPRKRERKRVPDLSPAVFVRVMARTPEYLRPAYISLAATGLRLGEFLALERSHLRAATFEVEVPGTKTDESEGVIPIDTRLWPQINAAVPCPVTDWSLRYHWKAACKAEGVRFDHLHDLRHCQVSGASTRGFRRPWCRRVCGTARRQ